MDEKIGFFKSFWCAITNFEKYKEFAYSKTTEVFKYIIIVLILFSLFITIALAIPVIKTVNDGIDYFEKEFPSLNYSEGKLTVDSEEPIYMQDERIDAIVLVDTNASLEDESKYLEEQKEHATSIFIFSDKLVVKTSALNSYITHEYTQLENRIGLDSFTKQDLLDNFSGNNIYKTYGAIYLFLFTYMFLTYIVVIFIDIIILSILALLVSKLYKVNLRYSNCIKLSSYALTLPLLLQLIYIYVNTLTGFTIEYFAIMYDVISYIYVITAILIMRNDLAKQDIGLVKEVKIEDKDEEEIITNEEVEKQKQEKKKKEKKKEKEKEKINPDVEPGKA